MEPKVKGPLKVQIDELWSFVADKGNTQWVGLALDVDTGEIMGCHIGDPSATSGQKLWESLPAVYPQCGVCDTDSWSADGEVQPSQRHGVLGQETGKTSYIEGFNCTLRQRVSRWVRKT